MEIRIKSVNFDATEQLKEFADKKVSKLGKTFEEIGRAHV